MRALFRYACATSVLSALFAACGDGAQEIRLVELDLALESSPPEVGSLSDYTRSDGWHLQLDEATLQLGSVYLRAPKRRAVTAWWNPILSVAHAHPGHAQTLTEGQVIGEHLVPILLDALSPAPVEVGTFLSEDTDVDRLSVVLGRSVASTAPVATLRGRAVRGGTRVDFSCALDIAQRPDEPLKNLEERRRVDQIYLMDTTRVTEGAKLRIQVHVWRWLEHVDFDAWIGRENPCAGLQSAFFGQWYLGIRRPEAFSAELDSRE